MSLDIAAGSAASGGLFDSLFNLLGQDGFKNLLSGGTSLFNAFQQSNALNFQKDWAKKADARTDILFGQDQEDRLALNNLNFGSATA